MMAAFVSATHDDLDRAVVFMSRLYEQGEFDEARARSSYLDLVAHPEFGGLWWIEVDGQAVGYVVLTICYSLEFHGRFVLLDELYIEPPWRGRGLGGKALAFADRYCRDRGLKAIRLEVWRQNPRAIELYKRSGYEVDDRHLMTKWVGR